MQIYLFRHGETDWNKAWRLQGQSDIPLNEAGRQLAARTGEALREIPFDRIFSSPLHRALETAGLLAGGREIPLETDRRLMEMCFGSFEGKRYDNARRQAPGHPLHDFFCCPECYVPPEGAESFSDVIGRSRAFLQDKILPLEGICENVLIVAHGALNRGILCAVADIPLERFWQIKLPNCAASILELKEGKLAVKEESRVYCRESIV